MSAVADVLRRAAEMIEPEGAWTQGWWARDADGQPVPSGWTSPACRCLDGALRSSATTMREYLDADATVRSYLRADTMAWNDAPERTQAEVVAALRAAAERADV